MVERRKFHRRKRADETPEDPPIYPLERREDRLARREADREAQEARVAEQLRAGQQRAERQATRQQVVADMPCAVAPQPAPEQVIPPAESVPAFRRPITHRTAPQAEALWDRLPVFPIDTGHLERNRIITASRDDPAHAAFDVLRTRLTQALAENGWSRVGITSPSKGCGKTFTAANLAISLSRQEGLRALLMDLDLRNPSLHKVLGVQRPGAMGALLRGAVAPEGHLLRMGENRIHAGHKVAFGFNEVVEPYAAELLNAPATAEVITSIEARLQPDVMLFDLPPALYYDDVLAFRPQIDGVLLVVGGGITTEREIREVQRRLGTSTPLLGMVLNKAEGTDLKKYQY
ncbi:CpsD/CapB family tyrosine-protein kinase [Salipiger mangrovisoli]|uniref:Exopolysaccharide biosynthesis protein n=1 Tax=Salipiger mangrovisoli TaxID=2865933 RepID=A0ABR9WXP6_9RHOB|nr:CpsD/CapB family tyrosine-protein kinase [Salipiger mangrovisoli]MBE9636035.1 exopolysaccharide biosynthesis protein [Salipiger mangrovisoli]